MYERHFGLTKPPFRITPDPEFFFPGGNRGAVLEALVYAISRGEGMVKVVGEVGSGKTMLCRMLERELPDSVIIIYLANPRLSAAEILHAIAFELKLGLGPDHSRLEVMHALQDFLLARHAENRRVVMFVEEAQAMPLESLEEIRMLSNLETTQEKLLQIVLFGQPELDLTLARHEIRQLRERITHSFTLAPFDHSDVRDYLQTRVRASGHRGNALFSAPAVRAIEHRSRGLLRRINVLADKALLAAFADNASRVEATHVKRAAQDSGFDRPGPRPRTWLVWSLGAALIGALVALGAVLSGGRENVLRAPGGDAPPAAASDATTMLKETLPARPDAGDADAPRPPHPVPRVSAVDGLVGDDHLAPRLAVPKALGRRFGSDLPGLPIETD
ncbi:MAG: AAA family ATPase [Gammaproteobacteria bacterium]